MTRVENELRAQLREAVHPGAIRNARRDGTLGSFDWRPLRTLLPHLTADVLNTTELEPGSFALSVVAWAGPAALVAELLAAGADASLPRAQGVPALMAATGNPNPRVLSLMIEHGANVAERSGGGLTALHHAAHASLQHVRILLEAGADPLALSNVRETPIDISRKRLPRDPEIEATLITAARLRLEKTKGSTVRQMRTVKPGGLSRFVKRRHDAGLRFLLLAAKLPAAEVASAIAQACGGRRVETNCASRRVFGESGVFVVRRRGSPWSLAYLSLGAPRPDAEPALRLARDWARRETPIDVAVFRSGIARTWRDGLEATHPMAESKQDLSLLDEHVSGLASLGPPIADWAAFLDELALPIDDALDASNGVELVLEIEAKKSDFEDVCVVVMEE